MGHLRPSNRVSGVIAPGGANAYGARPGIVPMTDLERHAEDYIEEAKSAVDSVTADELADEIEAGDVTVVDVREDRERWTDGAIPDSVHASRGGIEYSADPESDYHLDAFDPDRRYVCHCSGGSRGAMAAARLQEMGYDDVAYLEGGFRAWQQAGHEVEDVEPPDPFG